MAPYSSSAATSSARIPSSRNGFTSRTLRDLVGIAACVLSRPFDKLRATSRGSSASQNLRLLRSEFFLGQHTGRFELPKLLKLGKHVGFRRCLRRWRRG